ncbi:MAG: GAF domain-containing protein [Anaerolineales bacterium]|nr:GAF domain-containing protein [Anaerolineales bacterium]
MPRKMSFSPENDSRLLQALGSLNQISSAINRIGPDDVASSEVTLQLIVESAIRVVQGVTAVIYTYDNILDKFEKESRVFAGIMDRYSSINREVPDDAPRPGGIGMRAITQRRSVISYEEPDLDIHPFHAQLGVKAVAGYPLIVADQTVGVLYLYLYKKREFSRMELLMLDNFVNQAAMAIYHSRRMTDVRKDLARKEDELNQLHRAGMLISSRLELEETLESILQLALEMTNAQYGIFRLVDKSGQALITRAIAGEHLALPMKEALPLNSNSVMGWVARNRQPLLISDLEDDPWSKIYYPFDAKLEMRSELAIPLINASGRLEGVLNLESPAIGAFNENDSHMLQSLATYAVTAIQEVRLLDALQEASQLLLTESCKNMLNHLAITACDLLNASASAIWSLKGNKLVLESSNGGHQHGDQIPVSGSLTGQAILDKAPVVTHDISSDTRFQRPDLAKTQNWSRALIVPLLDGDENLPLGAFSVYSASDDPGRFAESDWDKKVLTFLAQYATLAFRNEARQEALRSAQEQRAVAETFAAVGDIASNLLHHLNNKVGTIPVRVQSIEDKCRSSLDNDDYLVNNLTEIERCAMDAMQTVRDNLSHLRPIRLEPVYVAARIVDAINTANLPPTVRVQTEGLDHLPVVTAGGQSLTFVFTNLIENASHAMQGEGTILVQACTKGNWVEICITDSGPGILPDLHDRIFELNFSGRTRPGKLGFGLWWVKTLMTRLGGSITVESDGKSGTTFILRLPRAEGIQ